MSLKAIKLPESIISSLYTSNLIQGAITNNTIDEMQAKETPARNEFKFFGNNEKKVLVIVNSPGVDYLPEDEMQFLTNMLNACKLSIKDIAIVNVSGLNHFSYREITQLLETRIALLINTEAATIGLPLDFPYFQVQPFSNMTFLSSPSLSDIKNDQLQKSKLWVCLRRIFNV